MRSGFRSNVVSKLDQAQVDELEEDAIEAFRDAISKFNLADIITAMPDDFTKIIDEDLWGSNAIAYEAGMSAFANDIDKLASALLEFYDAYKELLIQYKETTEHTK